VKKILLNFRAICSLGTLSLFVFFLAASQPHRVHHLLENLRVSSSDHVQSHSLNHHQDGAAEPDGTSSSPHADTTKHDANHDASTQTNCVVQAAAHHARFAILTCTVIPFSSTELTSRSVHTISSPASFNPSPFGQRAPPAL
jgi:hypothetical protein